MSNGRPFTLAPKTNACGISHTGRVRRRNEDALYISPDGLLLIVADGMGGHLAGEVASTLGVQEVADFVTADRMQRVVAGDLEARALLTEATQSAHRRIHDVARSRPDCRGMGTTLVVGLIVRDRLWVCHVGDSRAYLSTGDGLHQLTQDHSVVGALIRSGKLPPGAARTHPRRSQISRALGLEEDPEPDVTTAVLHPGDMVVLCSDGLWEMLQDEELSAILAEKTDLPSRAETLVRRACEAGGHDNVTVALYAHPGSKDSP